MKKKFGVKLVSLIGLLLSSCNFDFLSFIFPSKDEYINVESVTIVEKRAEIVVGEEFQLTAKVLPDNAENKEIIWKSSNADVASINNEGEVSALKLGSTFIEAISKENSSIKDSFELKVIAPELLSIEIKDLPTKTSYYEGDTFDPSGLVIKANYSNETTRLIPYVDYEDDFTFSLSLDKELAISDHMIIITFEEKSASFEIDITQVDKLEKTKLSYTYDDYTKNNYYTVDNCPLEGNPKLLIIPVWFNDSNNFISESKKESVRNDIEKAYTGTTEETGWHSVKSYYETESFNKLTLSATVTDWYDLDKSYTEYAQESKTSQTVDLIKKASDDYFSDHSSDNRKNYDSNKDGYLDGVMIIYAAPDYMTLGNDSYKNLWAYCYWTGAAAVKAAPTANVFFWASYDFLYGSNVKEKTGHLYARGYTENGVTVDTHCFIHEMGHVFGLLDYYDYSNYDYTPAGGFSMQDYNVGGHDPYSVISYGWADPYIPNNSMTISLRDFQSTHDVILLANHSVTNSPFDEYLLLEYYTPTGLNEFDSAYQYRDQYPQGPSVRGIRLWHVDARLYSYSRYKFTTNPNDGDVYHSMSNSYDANHGSYLGEEYYNYNILQLIRNDTHSSYTPKDNLSAESLFKAGETFDMSTFSSQFVNGSKMNDKNALGWSFKVEQINENRAIITLTKN